jgi:hypothetical protein
MQNVQSGCYTAWEVCRENMVGSCGQCVGVRQFFFLTGVLNFHFENVKQVLQPQPGETRNVGSTCMLHSSHQPVSNHCRPDPLTIIIV